MRISIVLRITGFFIAALLLAATAHAQLFRAYLDPTGSDANPCTLPQPCRLLPRALTVVADGGEIWMLDSANYNAGPVNITKSVTILAVPGVVGSVVATGGNAIDIATAGVKVALRNLVIVPLPGGGGIGGINMTDGAGLTVENCLIANLPNEGIVVSTAATVRITDTTIRGNGGNGVRLQNGAKGTVTRVTISENINDGIRVQGLVAGTTTADIADSTIDGNASGVLVLSNHATAVVKVSVRDSRLVRNADSGASVESNLGAAATLSVSNNMISNNFLGIAAFFAGCKVWASGNTVSENGTGLHNNASATVFETAGNNAVRNNGTDAAGTITVIATM